MSIVFIAFAIIAGFVAFTRTRKNSMASERSDDVLGEIVRNEDYASAFAETLDLTVVIKKNIDVNAVRKALLQIKPFQLDNYSIKSFKELTQDSFLCLTVVKYDDIEYRRHGNITVEHILDLNFKILLNEESQNCRIYSDLHETLTDKTLREEFVNKFWAFIEKK
ncbi:hypothetical protein VB264_02280 [Arcicella aquatica]|uniref:DUF2726 domain-containing protein n=1 Tax=Arcicella aquatica TaxID=217141 RepID=A0ABU5QHQ2_9BACT|nr:hypothetical protein [Arcicella aquatica]MEA5256592.1 hypothetical protein [Arcicella aquatica]